MHRGCRAQFQVAANSSSADRRASGATRPHPDVRRWELRGAEQLACRGADVIVSNGGSGAGKTSIARGPVDAHGVPVGDAEPIAVIADGGVLVRDGFRRMHPMEQ